MEVRSIIFRGKQVDNGEWVYGSFCPDAIELLNYISDLNVDGYIRNFNTSTQKMQMFEVDRETVGQYTGLTDKNGTKIFEGDICNYGDYVGYIEYDEAEAMFVFIYDENVCTNFDCLYGKELEVIGNIHDDSELLEVQE